jgi:Flp pilus assembly protein TadG
MPFLRKISDSNTQPAGTIRGFSLLEQALAFPAILVTLLGAFDLSNYYRAKNALQEATVRTLRCLTPADAECLQYAPPVTRAYFDAYLTGAAIFLQRRIQLADTAARTLL